MDPELIKKLHDYKTPKSVVSLIQNTHITFLVGITAAGKDTVLHKLLQKPGYHHIVSHTTRKPRRNHGVLERDGIDYHFVSMLTAERMLDNGDYVEAKIFSDNVYGTSVAEIQTAHDEGKIAITDIEVQGVVEYRNISENVVPIFLLPPDFTAWQQRLKKRYGNIGINPEELRKRLETARLELREALTKPYFEYVINEDLDTTINVIDKIAHGNYSIEKNTTARKVARHLVTDLDKHLSLN